MRIIKTHSALAVADYLINKSHKKGRALTPLKVIKLTYLCHGWMLGLYGRSLIDEPVEAWQYGPIIPSLYDKVRGYRANPVPVKHRLSDGNEKFDDDECNVMDQVIDVYKYFSDMALSRITHERGTPWDITVRNRKRRSSSEISNLLIEHHFKGLLVVQEPGAFKDGKELQKEAEVRAHERRETVRDLFLLLAKIGVWAVFSILLISSSIWGWYLLTSVVWFWPIEQQIADIPKFLSGVLLALFVVLLNEYAKRHP